MLLEPEYLLYLAGIAVFTGFIKAGMPAMGALLSVTVALVFSPQQALGIILCYLLIGDVIAVCMYWRLAHWQELKLMVFPVLIGIGVGSVILSRLDNEMLGFALGILVLFMVLMEPFRPRLTKAALAKPRTARSISGVSAGVATTLGNAAGPIMAIYFLVLNLDKRAFIGTGSIFFLFVNLVKLPVFVGQGLVQTQYFASIALTAPLVLVGALAGRQFLQWVSQLWFNRAVLFFTAMAGVWLLADFFSLTV